MQEFRQEIDRALESVFSTRSRTELIRAAEYVVLGGGHRWRGCLALAAGRIFDAAEPARALPLATALELFHAASLVLDDLPSMDDARMRRGRECVHRVFPAWVVDMLPACLVNRAFEVYAGTVAVSHDAFTEGLRRLGAAGMELAHGQELDLALPAGNVSEDELLDCYARKSGALFAAALAGGARICGAGQEETGKFHRAGLKLGQAYQILDDLRDAPLENRSCTATALWGPEGARARAEQLLQEADKTMASFGPDADPLREVLGRIGSSVS